MIRTTACILNQIIRHKFLLPFLHLFILYSMENSNTTTQKLLGPLQPSRSPEQRSKHEETGPSLPEVSSVWKPL